MKNITEDLPKEMRTPMYELDSLKLIMEEGGIKLWSKFWKEISILHSQERGYLPTSRKELISSLRTNTDWNTSQIVELVNNIERIEKQFPSYNLKINEHLKRVEMRYNSIIPFKPIGEMMIGFVKEDGIKVYEGYSGIKIGDINENFSINWNNNITLTPIQQRYVVDGIKELKENII